MSFDKIKEEAMQADSLYELFTYWKRAHAAEENYEETTVEGIDNRSFNADGYLSEKSYWLSNRRILFILKEANILDYLKNDVPSERMQYCFYREYFKEFKSNHSKMQEKIARMAFYLQNPELSDKVKCNPSNELKKNALMQIAFMNLNKRGGANKELKCFKEYIEKYSSFIDRQIYIMNPDFIVILGKNIPYCPISNYIKIDHPASHLNTIRKEYEGQHCIYSKDLNVDRYMRAFFKRVEENEK